jgi:hypothetical protein
LCRSGATLLVEVGADVDEKASEVKLIFHWGGGRHSEVRLPKNRAGFHGKTTGADALAVIRAMSGRFDDSIWKRRVRIDPFSAVSI